MLYPLSYEGPMLCVRRGYRATLCCWVRAGRPVPDGLCRICAACRAAGFGLPARRARPIVRLVVSGHFRRDGVGHGSCDRFQVVADGWGV
jgi:hypothetical protein